MPDQRSRPASRRARPVAELELEPLLEDTGELARSWAIALILNAPPESLANVPLEDLALEAPELLGAVLAALASEEDLERLLGGRARGTPAAGIPRMSGRADVAGVVAAVESLRGVLSDALMDRFAAGAQGVRARQLSDLADRLAHVCAAIVPPALEGIERDQPVPGSAPAPVPVTTPSSPQPVPAPAPVRGRVAIIDELAPDEPRPAPGALRDDLRAMGEPSARAEIQVRDERGDEGPAAWIRSIGRQLDRYEGDRGPFAVLLVELRGEAAERDENSSEALERLLADAIPAGATVTREWSGRYWLVVPALDRLGAGSLAAELTASLESAAPTARGPSVAVGTAVCPEDGTRASALAAHADVGLFAARAERSLATSIEGRPGF
jgi:hypothetical protein